ncbi:carbohydrate ABC transporter permease [Pseudochelatococcus sp. B33]
MSQQSLKPGTGRFRHLIPLIGVLGVALYLFPIYWMLISGIKPASEIFAQPPTFFPHDPTLEPYRIIFRRENILRYMANSMIISFPVVLIALGLGSMGAYALSRLKSRIVDAMLILILLLQVFPEALLATPIFIIFQNLGILNTYLAVILATASKALAFALVVLRPMFKQVPVELEQASYVDGCSRLQTFWIIVLPLMRIPLLVVGAIVFAQAYGQFVYPLTLLNRQEMQPGTVGIYSFVGAEYADWNNVMAFSSIFVIPILILFLVLQKKIVSGLTAGALK